LDPITFSLCGIPLSVACEDPRQADPIVRLWQQTFAIERACNAAASPAVHIRFQRERGPSPPAESVEEVSRSDALTVTRTRSGFSLECGGSILDLDLTADRALGVLHEDFWAHSLSEQREFFLLCFLMLLRRFGAFGLHANCVVKANRGFLIVGVKANRGFLIVGPSGAGKTTLTIALVREGWHFVADDALVLREGDGDLEAFALRLADGKRLVEIDSTYRGRIVSRCTPRVLAFPKVTREPRTEIAPLEATEAMTALLEQSPGILTDRSGVERQLATLRQLMQQSRCVRVRLGSDVFSSTGLVTSLLERIESA
jgi:hypothetical protein